MKKSLYGSRQAAANWFDNFKTVLEYEGLKKSGSMSFCNKQFYCGFLRWLFLCTSQTQRYNWWIIENLSKTFKLTDEGGVQYYPGTNYRKYPNQTIIMSQSEINDKILNRLYICDESRMHDTPANVILTKDEDGNGRKQRWHYCAVIVQIYYLAGTTRPNIIFPVHQCVKYSRDQNNPMKICQKDWTLFKEDRR